MAFGEGERLAEEAAGPLRSAPPAIRSYPARTTNTTAITPSAKLHFLVRHAGPGCPALGVPPSLTDVFPTLHAPEFRVKAFPTAPRRVYQKR